MASARLKGSFIYLANAVHDMTGNWTVIALALAPLAAAASLCLLPEALNLQHELTQSFEGGMHSVGWHLAQTPYAPSSNPLPPLFPEWEIRVLDLMFALVTYTSNLLVLCTLARIQAGVRESKLFDEVVAIYRRALHLLLSFLWIGALQLLVTVVGFVLLVTPGFLAFILFYAPPVIELPPLKLLLLPALLVFIWLYFAQYALVFDNRRGWAALLYSRELMRGQFFKAATRVVVFLAVWSGYNSWSTLVFVGVGFVLSLLAITAGTFWVAVIFVLEVVWTCVTYATTAFFYAAGVRLYQDLNAMMRERIAPAAEMVLPATAPLSDKIRA